MKKRKQIIMAGLILILVVSCGIGSAWAYFTTNARAEGSKMISFSDTDIHEDPPENNTKQVIITNNEDSSVDVFVRARAYVGEEYEITVQEENGWSGSEDGWSYYASPLAPGESSETLLIGIENVLDIPDEEKEGGFVNVAVVYECIDASYDENGNVLTPTADDWNTQLKESLREEAE